MVRVAVIGAGFMGRTHFDCYMKNQYCQVSYVFDAQIERAQPFLDMGAEKVTDNFDEVLHSNVDIIDICLPTWLHMEYAIRAAEAKKHILCEKPMALSVADCEKIITACKENGVKLMVAHVTRFSPEYAYLRETVNSGNLGRLIYLRSGRRQAMPAWTFSNWMSDPKLSMGGVVDLQIHDIDLALSLFGPPQKLKSVGNKSRSGGWEQVTTVMRFADGAVCCTEACNMMPVGYPFTAVALAVFENGSIDLDVSAEKKVVVHKADESVEYPVLDMRDGYQVEVDYFVDCIRLDQPVEIGAGEDGMESLRLSLISKDSLDQDCEIILV